MSKPKDKANKKNKSTERPEQQPAASPSMEEFKPSPSFASFMKMHNMGLSSVNRTEPQPRTDFKLNHAVVVKIDEATLKLPTDSLQSIEEGQPISITRMKEREKRTEPENVFKKTKKYDIALPTIGGGSALSRAADPMEIEQDEGLVQPSEIYELPSPRPSRHCIFQTPMLPNFQQNKLERTDTTNPIANFFQREYDSCGNEVTENYKSLTKEGVYKIGKIKIKGKRAELIIGDVKMEACLGYGEGRAVAVAQDNMYEVGNWSGMWIVQPTAELFD